MPRHPELSPSLGAIHGSAFSRLADRLHNFAGETYPFHIGDTWLAPLAAAKMEALQADRYPGLNRYSSPQGLPRLRDRIAERVAERSGPVEPQQVLITAGATGGLGAAVGALIEPGEKVLLLAPYWPLIEGIVRTYRAEPVAVSILDVEHDADAVRERLRAAADQGVSALYLGTPNNPTGRRLPREVLETIVEEARRNHWWLLADEVYEDLVYSNDHVPMRALAPERTFAAHSFSKAYGMAGYRCGYMIGPAEAMPALQKISTHAWYSTPTPSQVAALEVLSVEGDRWLENARLRYTALARETAARLNRKVPEGSTFLFLDLADRLDDRGLQGFLEDAVARGLFLAPGPSFGPYPTHARMCFTACEPDRTRRGVEILAELLGSGC
jgi:N-succinyldiaminopimelate aminotransferase